VYSPKIAEKLIPVLYHAAKDQGVPMTVLVNRLLTEALAKENLPQTVHDAIVSHAVPAPEVLRAQADRQLVA